MDATGRGLLRAIVAEPGDDTPRLAFADWLDEHGEADRAEFIRVQCGIANGCLPGMCICTRGCDELRRRESGLLADRGYGWCDGLLGTEWKTHGEDKGQDSVTVVYHRADPTRSFGRAERVRVGFRRGFPTALDLTAECWLAHADALHWHPSQTVRCPDKDCEGGYYYGGGTQGAACGTCDGTGTVPRPFPETAQPLTDVTLTTEPPWGCGGWPEFPDKHCLAATAVTLQRWPGVTFHLPPIPDPISPTAHTLQGYVPITEELIAGAGAYQHVIDQMEQAVVQSLGTPAHLTGVPGGPTTQPAAAPLPASPGSPNPDDPRTWPDECETCGRARGTRPFAGWQTAPGEHEYLCEDCYDTRTVEE